MDIKISMSNLTQPTTIVFQKMPPAEMTKHAQLQSIAWQTQTTLHAAKSLREEIKWTLDYQFHAPTESGGSPGSGPTPAPAPGVFQSAEDIMARLRSQSSLLDTHLRALPTLPSRSGGA